MHVVKKCIEIDHFLCMSRALLTCRLQQRVLDLLSTIRNKPSRSIRYERAHGVEVDLAAKELSMR